jgi:hypothetical protein
METPVGARPADPERGRLVDGRYRLDALIAECGMGTV